MRVGAIVELAVPLGLAGLFAGFVAGLVLVHARLEGSSEWRRARRRERGPLLRSGSARRRAAGLPGRGPPMLGYAVLAAVWLAPSGSNYRRGPPSRARRRQPPRAMGWVGASTLGRVWLVALPCCWSGCSATARTALPPAVLAAILFTVHFACRFIARAMTPPEEEDRMKTLAEGPARRSASTSAASCRLVIFGSSGENDAFQPQNEFKLEPWVHLKVGRIDMSINKAVLYLALASAATIATMSGSRGGCRRSPTGCRPPSSSPTT